MKRILNTLRPWELALLMALGVTVCAALWADGTQRRLSGELVRLHVIANSDTASDQAAKLAMRDEVLALLTPVLAGCRTQEEAVDAIARHLPDIEALGGVTASLGREYYPTREYDTFSLPAGEYVSLRVTMGEGAGRNWWCVVFPPLCTEALTEETEDAFLPLGKDGEALVTQSDEGYVIKFHIVEWWGQLKERLAQGRGPELTP